MEIEQIDGQIAALQKQRSAVLKESKKKAIEDVKKAIATFKLTKGDLRGKTMKQLLGKSAK